MATATSKGISKNILNTRRLTAGVITGNGVHSLDNPRFLKPYRERARMKKEKEEKSATSRKKKVANTRLHGMMKKRNG